MEPMSGGLIACGIALLLLLVGVPIAFSLGIGGSVGIFLIRDWATVTSFWAMTPFSTIGTVHQVVLPLFILMGHFAFVAGITRDAYDIGRKWVGKLPGGLAIATVFGCAAFAACCGSSVAEAAAMGKITIPEMRKHGYQPNIAAGLVASAGALGILIPPSLILVLYGIVAEVSIAKMLLAGIIPGILCAIIYSVGIIIMAYIQPAAMGRTQNVPYYSWKERIVSLKGLLGIFLVFFSVMGSIWFGLATASEASALGVGVTLVYLLLRSKQKRKDLTDGMKEAASVTCMILLIIVCAGLFGMALTLSQIPQALSAFVADLALSRWIVMILMLLAYFILGCFMDGISMLFLTIPIFLPIVNTLHFDPVWFGVIVTIMIEVGVITPPVGLNVYVIAGVAPDIPMYDIFKGVIPFLLMELFALAFLVAFPAITLWLPKSVG